MMMSNRFFFAFILFTFTLGLSSMAQAERTDQPEIKLQALNKSTARTVTLTAKVGETIEYGSLFIKTQACRKSDPLDPPENAAFLQIWEVPIGREKSEWAFSGWMFSSSPAVSAMDHAVYDVWVLNCFDSTAKVAKPVNKVIVNDVEFTEEDMAEQENTEESSEQTVEESNDEEAAENVLIESDAKQEPLDSMIESLVIEQY